LRSSDALFRSKTAVTEAGGALAHNGTVYNREHAGHCKEIGFENLESKVPESILHQFWLMQNRGNRQVDAMDRYFARQRGKPWQSRYDAGLILQSIRRAEHRGLLDLVTRTIQ
jgi:hypothetical protein